jgi:uncharacterized protein YutD
MLASIVVEEGASQLHPKYFSRRYFSDVLSAAALFGGDWDSQLLQLKNIFLTRHLNMNGRVIGCHEVLFRQLR